MEKRVVFSPFEKAVVDDFNELGLFPRDSIDTLVRVLGIPDIGFSGFAVVESSNTEVTVGAGKLFDGGKVFFNDTEGGFRIDLVSRTPAVTKRIVAITVSGQEQDAVLEPRTFLTDSETENTVSRAGTTEHWRWANIGAVSGLEGPDPQIPGVAANVMPVAWVTLTNTGIESITMNSEGVVPSLREADNRLNALDAWRALIGAILDTLRSDIVALYARLVGLAPLSLVRQIANDVANMKEAAKIPAAFSSYGFDHFLTPAQSETTHVDYLARVEEGVRFPPAAGFDAQLGLLNPFNELVTVSSNVLLPAWDLSARLINVGSHAEVSISQYQYQTISVVQKTMTRQVTRYGTPFTVCSNNFWWNWDVNNWQQGGFNYTIDYLNNVMRRDTGEVFQILDPAGGDAEHTVYRVAKIFTDTITVPYWEAITNNYSVNGAVVGQSFLNAQDGWLAQVKIYFSRVASTGSVTLLVCELTNGVPDTSKVIAQSVVAAADLKVSPAGAMVATNFSLQPTFLGKKRYAFVLVSAGNHFLWVLKNTNNFSGTFFTSTDGDWFQGDLTTDLAFEAHFCGFRNNRSLIQLQSLQLSGGIAAIDINADTFIPDGCRLSYEVQVSGVWHELASVDGGPDVVLNGLPPLLPFRAVFLGTNSVQPALGVASNSRVTTWRPRSDFKHVSKVQTLPTTTTDLQVDIRVEAWRGAPYHTFLTKLLVGVGYATVVNPTTTASAVAPDNPEAMIFHYAWTGLTATATFRLRLEGTTDNVLATYHVAQRFFIDITP